MGVIVVCDECKSQNVHRVKSNLFQCKDCKTVFTCDLPQNKWGIGDSRLSDQRFKRDPITPRPISERWK